MARDKGTFNFSANFEVLNKAPLDARQVVGSYADLINPSTWLDSNSLIWLFNGAIVSVANDVSTTRNGIYFLKDANNYTDYSNWEKSTFSGITDVSINNVGDGSVHIYAGVDLSTGAFKFKSLKGIGAAILSETNDLITLSLDASFSGEVNTASNVGTGDVSLFWKKQDQDLKFKSIKGSSYIILSNSDPSTIHIDVSLGNKVNKSGDNMTGDLNIPGINITNDLSVGRNAIITGNLKIEGNLNVDGSTTYINSSELDISTNFIKLNTGLIGVPPEWLQSGIVVKRGSKEPYVFIFDETDQTFRIGIVSADSSNLYRDSSTQAVATRENNPVTNGIAIYNHLLSRFDTSLGLVFDSSNGLYIDGSLRISSLRGTGIRYVTVNSDGILNFVIPPYIKEVSIGNTFKWDTSGFLQVDTSAIGGNGRYNTLLDSSLLMPTAVGGYPIGTSVSELVGDTFITMFDNLLFPTTNPTLTAPSRTFTLTLPGSATYIEIGADISITFTATFNRGSISPQYNADSPYRSGLPNNYNYEGVGLIDVSSTALSNTQIISYNDVSIGWQPYWYSQISYDSGVQPFNNKGIIYDVSLAAGTTVLLSTRFEGVYPLYATTVDINTLTKQSLVSMLSGNNITINLVGDPTNYQKFDIPVAWTGTPTNRPLVGVLQYNTVSGQWEYPGGSAASSLLIWTTSSVTETVQGNVINYTRYTYNQDPRGAVQIRLVF
ncbi:MAG: hypothetical protein PHF86_00470 [Candidatus Nanoarchaeia archaeon]|nr:hypothetical protein [Candidatus Nanoarchaeia archaeon]